MNSGTRDNLEYCRAMYGLPANFDASLFVGRTLQLICFSANQIYLHFDTELMLTMKDGFSTGKELQINPHSSYASRLRCAI